MDQKPEEMNDEKLNTEVESEKELAEFNILKKKIENLEKRNNQTLINVAISIIIIMVIIIFIAYNFQNEINDNKAKIDQNSATGRIHLSIRNAHRTDQNSGNAVSFETTIINQWGAIGPYSLVVVASWINEKTGETYDQNLLIVEVVLKTGETFTTDTMLFIDDFDNGHALILLYFNGQEIDSKTAF